MKTAHRGKRRNGVLLADSSAWILLGVRLVDLVESPEELIATCPPVVQEILQGSHGSSDYRRWRRALLSGPVLDAPVPLERYEEAAQLFLLCRNAGFTIRRPADCLIAACALAHDAEILHNDRDFQFIAQVTPLKARRVAV